MPRLSRNFFLNFYGGEPLLAFGLIQKTVSFLNFQSREFNKIPHYTLTTNGSLLSKEIFQFLDKQKFSVILSFDSLAQDVSRKKGSFRPIVASIGQLLSYPKIDLEVNSVFTPRTVDCLSESMEFLTELNIPKIRFSLATIEPWNSQALLQLEKEMIKLRKLALTHHVQDGDIPFVNFQANRKKGIFYCAAGKDRLSLTPEGEIWGCYLFPDLFQRKKKSLEYQKYYFGRLNQFIKNYSQTYPRILANYAHLSMDNFSTAQRDCFSCPDLENCSVCPVNASFSGTPLAKIPDYLCQIQRIKIREIHKLKKQLQALRKASPVK